MKKVAVIFLKETLIQMIISTVLLALIAFVVLKISPSVATIKIMVLIIYGIASFCGGVIVGKVMEARKFVWGALCRTDLFCNNFSHSTNFKRKRLIRKCRTLFRMYCFRGGRNNRRNA